MTNRISKKEYDLLIRGLPPKDRRVLLEHPPDAVELERKIEDSRQAMRNDLYFGIPWVVLYLISLFLAGFNSGTIALLLIGILYFTYSFFTRGSFGTNRRRVKVYGELLKRMNSKT